MCLRPLPKRDHSHQATHQGKNEIPTPLFHWKGSGGGLQHPPRHSSSRCSGAKKSGITAHSHRATEKQFLSWPHFPHPAALCILPTLNYDSWRQSHLTMALFLVDLHLLIFNTHFQLYRNLINPTIPHLLSIPAKIPHLMPS